MTLIVAPLPITSYSEKPIDALVTCHATDDESTTVKRCKGGVAVLVLLMFAVGGALSYFRLASGSQLRECERDMAANLAKYQTFRWESPVLRGQAVEGNSADAHRALYAQLQGLPKAGEDDLTEVLRNLKPLPEETKVRGSSRCPNLREPCVFGLCERRHA